MRETLWAAAVAFLLGVSGSAAPAGTPAPPGPARQEADQAQEQPRFRTGTTLVEVDAIVRDGQGRFVADLSPADFEVIEDGTPQTIEGFFVVTHGRVRGAPPPAVVPPLPPLEPSPPAAPAVQRVFVLFFDQEHMAPGGFDRARKAAESFVANEMQPGDVGGIVSGGTMINDRLTSSLVELQAALRMLKPRDEARSRQLEMRTWPRFLSEYEVWRINYRDKEMLGQVVARACNDDPEQCYGRVALPVDQIVQQKADMLVPELRSAGMRTIRTLAGLANGLAKLPGRKTIVLLSDGFFAEDSWSNLKELTGLAARASIRVYALDTRGLNRGSASSDIIDMGPHGAVNPAGDPMNPDTNIDAPNSLAVDTGGLMIRNENDFVQALHEIADDTSSYYLLAYRPTNERFDGSFRQIAVRVERPGLTVRARRGYIATPDLLAVPTQGVGTAPAPSPPAAPAAAPVTPAPAPSQPAPSAPLPDAGVGAPGRPAAQPSSDVPGAVPSAAPAAAGESGGPVRLRPDVGDEVSRLEKLPGRRASNESEAAMPAVAERQAREGWEAYQRGDVEAARTALSAAAASPAARPWVHYALGWSQFALADYRAASASWERVRRAVPEFEAVYLDLADAYLQQREFGKAVGVLREAERRWTEDVELLNALGVVQTARGAVNDAIETFEKAVALRPDDATSCFNLARMYETRYAQALAFRRMQSSNPYLRDRDRAIEYYRRTVQLGGPLRESAEAGLKRLEK